MTTRAEEIAAEGPYKVEPYPDPRYKSFFNIAGPGRNPVLFSEEEDAQDGCDDLNAAYKQGQQDRWISVKDKEPANGQLVLVWAMEHPNKAQSTPGFHLLPWVRHGSLHWPRFATWRERVTHWMPTPYHP